MKIFTLLLALSLPFASFTQELRRVVDLRGYWNFSIGDNPRWASPAYDDQSWEKIHVPSPWENEGFNGFDGYAWYRIAVDLRNISENNLYLVLGYIDDVDEVYLNGQLIGFNGSFPPNFYTAYQSFRKYYLPPELLNKNGQNIIAVRVFDTILEGGIIQGDVGIYTTRNEPEKTRILEGLWRFKEGDDPSWKSRNFDDRHWEQIMVPSYWRSLKMSHIEGIAWYRKEFILPEYLKKADRLALVLGLIDDFDETYLNGTLVGATNDGRPLGASDSWRQYRVYIIRPEDLIPDGKNVIAVRVKDIGVNAGIYKGPLGILPYDDYRQLLNVQH